MRLNNSSYGKLVMSIFPLSAGQRTHWNLYLSRTQETASNVFLVRVSEQHLLGILHIPLSQRLIRLVHIFLILLWRALSNSVYFLSYPIFPLFMYASTSALILFPRRELCWSENLGKCSVFKRKAVSY